MTGISVCSFAGNEDRVGSAGASHLLINPWARGSAIGDAHRLRPRPADQPCPARLGELAGYCG